MNNQAGRKNNSTQPSSQQPARHDPGKSNHPPARRTEGAGIFHFTKDMISALFMALIAIVYVIQAFTIPSGSMENSLKIGDFLLGLKFIYGAPVLPFSHHKLPGITNPKPGDVIIFKYPVTDNKDFIKRCVAGPGQTVQVDDTVLTVDGVHLAPPPKGQFISRGNLYMDMLNSQPNLAIMHFQPLRVPKKGDTLHIRPDMPSREFLYYAHLIHQENPDARISARVRFFAPGFESSEFRYDSLENWTIIDQQISVNAQALQGKPYTMEKVISMDYKPVGDYVCKYDSYFMMGDNRDNSLDSRYWGFVNRNYIKAKALIIYFSLDDKTPWWELPVKIRWNRIGKLIRSWDGQPKSTSKG